MGYINVTSPASDLPWTVGIVNNFEWVGLYWNTSQANYAQDRPFRVDIFPADLPEAQYVDDDSNLGLSLGPSGADLIATFTLQGTSGATGVKIPAKAHPGAYMMDFVYETQGANGINTHRFAVLNFTIVGAYEGSTTNLEGVTYVDAARRRLTSVAGLASLAVAGVMACVFVSPAIL